MPIVVYCSECGEKHRLAARHAGRSFRCIECDAVLDVPEASIRRDRRQRVSRPEPDELDEWDEFDDRDALDEVDAAEDDLDDGLVFPADDEELSERRPRGNGSGLFPPTRWLLIGGGGLGAVLLLGMMWFVFGGGGERWEPDPSIAEELTEEHHVGRYVLAAPPSMHVFGAFAGQDGAGGRNQLRLAGVHGSVQVAILRHPRFRNRTRAEVLIGDPNFNPTPGVQPELTFPEGELSYGEINGIVFTRVLVPNGFANQNLVVYLGYDGEHRIELRAMTPHDIGAESFLVVDGMARSFRRARPGEEGNRTIEDKFF